jgi:hypothetical protein
MKQKFLTFMIAILALSAIHVQAQQHDESFVKIMPTSKPGVLKLLHAIPTHDPISVQFVTDAGIVSSDEIKGDFPKGITKRYDFSRIGDNNFRMIVSSPTLSVTYHIVLSDDGKTFNSYLEKAVHSYNTMASTK